MVKKLSFPSTVLTILKAIPCQMCIYWLSNIDFQFCQPKFGAIPILQEGPWSRSVQMDLNKLRAPHLPIKPWDSDTALERRKILQVIFKPTISLVPVSLFCTVTCPPINRQQYYLDATTAAGNQLWIRSSGLPRRRGRVFTKLSTDTPLGVHKEW